MYLSNTKIEERLADLRIECGIQEIPFERRQIKICSLDLRLDGVFWEQKRIRNSIDLRKTRIHKIKPHHWWKKKLLNANQSIVLRPGEMILGRTYEKFYLPNDLAGKIQTRSSYSRLGITTHSSNDFINPGWHGHMPIEITNHSKNKILIYPYLPMCQLLLIPISGTIESEYKDIKFGSKYFNDDGGPSFWWRDDLLKKIEESDGKEGVAEAALRKFSEKIHAFDDDGLFRFNRYIDQASRDDLTNPDALLNSFERLEKRKKLVEDFLQWVLPLLIGSLLFEGTSTMLASGQFPNGARLYVNPVLWILYVIFFWFKAPRRYTEITRE